MRNFAREYANAVTDELRSTRDAIRTDRIQNLNQWRSDQEAIRAASRRMSRSALPAARL